jgi:2-oxoacid dehydrogenases acyltransferase (catalytic domain)
MGKAETRSDVSATATALQRSRGRDRVALITWPTAGQAQITCTVHMDWDCASAQHPGVAPVALVGFALAQALRMNPVLNRRVALWKIRNHKTVRVSFAVDAERELRIAVVDRADSFDSRQFQRALITATRIAREGTGPLARAISLSEWLPVSIGRPLLRIASLLVAGFGVRLFGVPGAPFGAALVSSLERFGLPTARVPLIPFTRCTLICSVGSAKLTPVVREGVLAVANMVEVTATIDHRVADATQLAEFLGSVESALYGETLPR